MSRLPVPGSDQNSWGQILNDYLSQSHGSDGTLKPGVVNSGHIVNGSVTQGKLSASGAQPGQVLSTDGTSLQWATPTGSGSVPDATASTKGLVRLTGDLGGTADAPTVPGLAGKADNAHTHAIADVTNLQTTLNGKEPTVTAGAAGQYYSGNKTWQTLNKAAVGLSNVDNTADANKPISTATQTALNAKADALYSVNAQTGTSYTLQLSDAGKFVTLTNSAAITVTVPTNTSAALPLGARVALFQAGTGQVTIQPAGGVTLYATPGLKIADQYGGAELVKLATNTWAVVGRLAA